MTELDSAFKHSDSKIHIHNLCVSLLLFFLWPCWGKFNLYGQLFITLGIDEVFPQWLDPGEIWWPRTARQDTHSSSLFFAITESWFNWTCTSTVMARSFDTHYYLSQLHGSLPPLCFLLPQYHPPAVNPG